MGRNLVLSVWALQGGDRRHKQNEGGQDVHRDGCCTSVERMRTR